MKTAKAAAAQDRVRPEQYHLERCPEIRSRYRRAVDDLEASMRKRAGEKTIAALKAAGFPIPKGAKFEVTVARYSGDSNSVRVGRVTLKLHDASLVPNSDKACAEIKAMNEAINEANRKASAVCKLITTGKARQFGAFCRTKFGPKPSLDVIQRAHGQWLDLELNCKC